MVLPNTVTSLRLIRLLSPAPPLARIPVPLLADLEPWRLTFAWAPPVTFAPTPAAALFSDFTLSSDPKTLAEPEGLKRIPLAELFRTMVLLTNTLLCRRLGRCKCHFGRR